jgi:phosphatidylethanolamine-binding protein (PEBP) family uncharacterized protein
MHRRSRLSLSSALGVSLFTTASLLASCSSEESGDDTPGGSGGTGGASAGSTAKGGSSGASGSASGAPAGGSGGSASGSGGAAGSKAGGAGSGGSAAGAGGAGGSGGTAGAAGGATGGAGSGGSAGTTGGGGSGGALGGAGSGGSGGGKAGSGGSAGGGSGEFALTSPAFEDDGTCTNEMRATCERFPDENISFQNNANQSPEFNWSGVPAGTQSFAIVLQDLENELYHWAIWNISGELTSIAANIPKDTTMPAMPAGSQQINSSFAAMDGYFGPGSECNVYQFTLYALSMETFSPSSANNIDNVVMQLKDLDAAILGTATLTGRSNYENDCNP